MKLLLCCLMLGVMPVSAQLTWTVTHLQKEATFQDTEAVGIFEFKNTGTSPVQVLGVTANCGCTTGTTVLKAYAPGETGEVKATMVFGDKVGQQMQFLRVQTNDPKNPEISLSLSVNIPETLAVRPKFVFWQMGQKRETKVIGLFPAQGLAVEVVEVKVGEPGQFTSEVKKTEAGYEVRVTPKNLDKEMSTNIQILTQLGAEKMAKTFQAHAMITRGSN
jgi:Protein of unknown function (DUF1573)